MLDPDYQFQVDKSLDNQDMSKLTDKCINITYWNGLFISDLDPLSLSEVIASIWDYECHFPDDNSSANKDISFTINTLMYLKNGIVH